MFENSRTPRVFALPPGVDFPRALIDGLVARCEGQPPEALARVHLVVNTRRMARRIRALFDAGPPRLLPRLSLITDLGETGDIARLPVAIPPLRRRRWRFWRWPRRSASLLRRGLGPRSQAGGFFL